MQDEFEAEKKASLHNTEQMLIQEREKAQAAHEKEQEMLTAQLQEKTAIIIQVRGIHFKLRFEICFCGSILVLSSHFFKMRVGGLCIILTITSLWCSV